MGAWYPASMSTTEAENPREALASRHEAAAVSDSRALGLLRKISGCATIPAAEAAALVDDRDDLRAFVRLLRAGWATAAPDGLLVTDRGRDVAGQLFADPPPAWDSEACAGLTDEHRERKAALIQMLADREQRPPVSRAELKRMRDEGRP